MQPTYSSFSRLKCISLAAFSLFLSGCAGVATNSGGTSSSTPAATLAISSVSPTDVPVGSADITVTVTGTGFTSGSTVSLNSTAEPTTYVSSTQLNALVSAAQLKVGTVLTVSVSTGTASVKADAATTALSVDNPVPSLVSVTPATIVLGAPDTTVTVTGTSFVQGVALSVNGTPRATTFMSDTQLTAQLSASDFISARTVPLNVINPKPGGGTSGTSSLSVNNPAPSITSLSPASVAVGSADTTVTLVGTGILSSSALQINGATRAATIVSGTQLTFVLSAADLSSAATLAVTLSNSLPGGGVSAASSFAIKNPVPVITSFAPATLTAGSDAIVLAITGTGFGRTSTAQVNSSTHASTYVSATEIDIPLTAADLSASGTLAVAINNAQPGGGTSAGASVPINNPVPAITSLTPANVSVGSAGTSVVIAGTGILPITTLQIDGKPHAVTYNNNKQLTLTLTAAELSAPASFGLTLTNAAPGGGTSSSTALTVTYPAPVITSLSPATVGIGSAATVVTITGTGFVPSSVVTYSNSLRSSTYVSSTQIMVSLNTNDFVNDGTYSIVVINPAASGGSSKASPFVVQAKVPVLTSVTPSSLIVNGGPVSIDLAGTNFTASSKVFFNSTQLTTSLYGRYVYTGGTYVTIYDLIGTVTNDLLAAKGTASITVVTPTAASASNAISVSITDPPVPTLTSLSPNSIPVGADAKLTIGGTGFTKLSVASYNGIALTTTFSSNITLTATVPASLLGTPGNGSITVSTPAPGGGTSTGLALTVYVPVVSNSMVFNPVNGLAYLSIPGTGSTVSGNSVVSFDPATGALGTPIFVGSEPGVMAVSDDGKTLWVALNGSVAIRKVDLVAGVAGAQYSVSALSNYYSTSAFTAILVLPGTTDSVALTSGNSLGIYDAGVLRGSTVNVGSAYALQADKSRSELYVGGYSITTYNYTSAGLTLRSTGNSNYSTYVASSTFDEMQLAAGKMFTDYGKVYDPESSALLGTFTIGTFTPIGPTFADTALSQVYVLNNSTGSTYSGYDEISLFNPGDYSNTGKSFSWNVPYSLTVSGNSVYLQPHRLSRWGTNGLILHTKNAIFTAQSNVIKDQSATPADLSVSLAASGGTTTGSTATYTATVKNSGPQAAADVAVVLQAPSTGILTSVTTTAGSCTSLNGCTLGSLASGASTTLTIKVLQTTAGTGVLNASVLASTTDPDKTNNAASSSIVVTGDTYNLSPTLTSLSPNAFRAGSADSTLTVNGSNFTAGSTVMLGTTSLATKFVSSTQMTATVPSASLASLGWSSVTVSTPAPGGGSSGTLPLSVFNVLTIGVNHLVYEPFSRKLYASVSSGSSTVAGNSLVSLDPLTGTFGTPFPFASAPSQLALSASGKTLYTGLSIPSNSTVPSVPFGRLDITTGTTDSPTLTAQSSYYGGFPLQTIAVRPGTENTLGVTRTNTLPSIVDYDSSAKTLTQRPSTGNGYYGTCAEFLDADNFLSTYSNTIDYSVIATGLSSGKSLNAPTECFQLSGNTAVTATGKVFNITTSASTQLGTFAAINLSTNYQTQPSIALDASLSSVFYPSATSSTTYGTIDGVASYDLQSYLQTGSINLSIPTVEGSGTYYNFNDLIRWGQDGLALVTSTGHIYLLRGPFVVPQELRVSTAAALSSSSSTSLAKGSGNTLLTLTGTNFLPGVAVSWNGSYRTTTVVDATHVTVAIPASDLTAAGTNKLVATNPGAPDSGTLTVTVQ